MLLLCLIFTSRILHTCRRQPNQCIIHIEDISNIQLLQHWSYSINPECYENHWILNVPTWTITHVVSTYCEVKTSPVEILLQISSIFRYLCRKGCCVQQQYVAWMGWSHSDEWHAMTYWYLCTFLSCSYVRLPCVSWIWQRIASAHAFRRSRVTMPPTERCHWCHMTSVCKAVRKHIYTAVIFFNIPYQHFLSVLQMNIVYKWWRLCPGRIKHISSRSDTSRQFTNITIITNHDRDKIVSMSKYLHDIYYNVNCNQVSTPGDKIRLEIDWQWVALIRGTCLDDLIERWPLVRRVRG